MVKVDFFSFLYFPKLLHGVYITFIRLKHMQRERRRGDGWGEEEERKRKKEEMGGEREGEERGRGGGKGENKGGRKEGREGGRKEERGRQGERRRAQEKRVEPINVNLGANDVASTLTVPPISYVTLSELLNPSGSQLPHLQNG